MGAEVVTDWAAERADVLQRFMQELSKATGDGSKKRQSGEKPPWYHDRAHEAAIFSHLMKWKKGELVDPDSGAHPLVHAAWRCLAIACQETGNTPVFPARREPDIPLPARFRGPMHATVPPASEESYVVYESDDTTQYPTEDQAVYTEYENYPELD